MLSSQKCNVTNHGFAHLMFVCTQIFQKVFLCMNIYDIYFQKLKKLCKYNFSLPIYDHFYAILRANFG